MLEQLKRNYNASVTIKRLADVSGTTREFYNTHLAGVACLIVPLDESATTDLEGSFGKDYGLYAEAADVTEQDRVIWGSREFRVVGVRRYEFMNNELMELRIREFNP